jgi:hypothetical protein
MATAATGNSSPASAARSNLPVMTYSAMPKFSARVENFASGPANTGFGTFRNRISASPGTNPEFA